MELSELLSELRENILHDRSNRAAGDSDLMWSDATLVRYINEAQRRFARQGLIIRDGSTPEVTQVRLKAEQEYYPLHKSVLAVISARMEPDNVDLTRAGHAGLDAQRPADDLYFAPSQMSLQPGKPLVFTTDAYLSADFANDAMSAVTTRFYPRPAAEYDGTIVNLRVVRMPLRNLELNNYETPEIPETHQLEMLDWAAYLALRIVDADAGDPARAGEFRTSFEAHVREARNIAMRKLFAPVKWGFGRNGFSWEK